MMFSCEATAPHNNYGCLEKENKTEFARIPEVMVKKAIMAIKGRGELMVAGGGRQFRGKKN